ncbi:MAG: GAF domain-containing protein [Anaerolineae bacterium]
MILRRLLPTTLKKQLVVYGALAILLAVTVTTLVNFRIAEAEAAREMRQYVFQVGLALQSALDQADPSEAQRILEEFHQASGAGPVREALLADPEGTIIASSRPESVGKPVAAIMGQLEHEAAEGAVGQFSQGLVEMTPRGVPVLGFSLPVKGDPANPDRVTATLHYVEPYTAYQALVQRALVQYFLSGFLLTLLLVVPLWFYLERSLLRPLRELTRANEAVAAGQTEGRLVPREAMPVHELGAAMRSRNEMLVRLVVTQDELRQHLRELAAFNRVAETVNRSLNLEETLPRVLDQVLALTGAAAADIKLVENDELQMGAGLGLSAGFLEEEKRVPLGQCLCGQAALRGQPRMAGDLQSANPERLPCLTEGFRSCLSVPVKVEGQIVGVIHLADPRPNLFNTWHETILTAVGQHVGLAIEKSQLYEGERSQRQLAETLRQVSQTLGASLDLEKVLHTVLEQLGQVLIVDVGLILLHEDDCLRVVAVRGRQELEMEQLLGYRLPVSANPDFEQVMRQKRPLTFCQPGRQPPFADGLHPIEEVDWCLVVPLLRGDEAIGLLALEQVDHCYDDVEEPQIALAFASHAVVAIENARLYAEVKALNEELEARVEQRTAALKQARETLARQADQLRHLLNQTIRIQEEERGRIAQDIHDGVSQLIMGALYEAQAAKVSLAEQPDVAREKLHSAQAILKKVKTEMRRLIYDLHPEELSASGLVAALETYVDDYQEHTGIRCALTTAGPVRRLTSERERAVYRIVQEALHNVAQHARADQARVQLAFNPGRLNITIEDNGCGFDCRVIANGSPGHLGLVSMQERAQSVGGELALHSEPGRGTRVSARLPLDDSRGVGQSLRDDNDAKREDFTPAGAQPLPAGGEGYL